MTFNTDDFLYHFVQDALFNNLIYLLISVISYTIAFAILTKRSKALLQQSKALLKNNVAEPKPDRDFKLERILSFLKYPLILSLLVYFLLRLFLHLNLILPLTYTVQLIFSLMVLLRVSANNQYIHQAYQYSQRPAEQVQAVVRGNLSLANMRSLQVQLKQLCLVLGGINVLHILSYFIVFDTIQLDLQFFA